MASRRVGIFGGTFNPIHSGHINSATTVAKRFSLDEVLIIPTSISPGRDKLSVPTPEQRLEMCRLGLKDYDQLVLDDREVKRGGVSYTVETLEELKNKNPENDYFLIVGLDNFYIFDKWKEFSKIIETTNLIVTSRPGYAFPDGKEGFPEGLRSFVDSFDFNHVMFTSGKSVDFVKLDDINISSSEIRKLYRTGKKTEKYLLLEVEDYIRDNKIYDRDGEKVEDFEVFSKFCMDQLVEKKAQNVFGYDLSDLNKPCDFAVISSGISTKHAQSLAENVVNMVSSEFGIHPLSVEGVETGRWVLVDYGALIIHIFYDYVREEYNLEELWSDGKRFGPSSTQK